MYECVSVRVCVHVFCVCGEMMGLVCVGVRVGGCVCVCVLCVWYPSERGGAYP